MNSSMCTADANTHFKIIATALMAASVVVWVGIAARVPPSPPVNFTVVPVQLSTVPGQPSMVTMASEHSRQRINR